LDGTPTQVARGGKSLATTTDATAADFQGFATEVRPELDAALTRYTELGAGCPARLREAMRYSLLASGKRIRPLLTLLAADGCAGDWRVALPAACAVEMVHVYSLIHDDLPAMDDDDLRRGRPTNHKVYGEGLAILAGDALLTLAFEVLATEVQPAAAAARSCAALGRAAGAAALVGGQADDLAAGDGVSDLATLESIHARKTGAMLCVSLELGGIAAGASAEELSALAEYGKRLGLAFQITDDLLDVCGDASRLGKRVQKDADKGKLTFPGVLGVEASARRAAELVDEACAVLAGWGSRKERLCSLARYVLERDR